MQVDDCKSIEKYILKKLRRDSNINNLPNIGKEYFECNNKNYIINFVLQNIIDTNTEIDV